MPRATRKKSPASRFRVEHDLLGELRIPNEAYFGVQTARAIDNFHISGVPISHYPHLIQALAIVKLAAARANHDSRALDRKRLRAIELACNDVIEGKFDDHFPVDMFQGGAGTSTNMNANEVIANAALEHMGKRRGDYAALDPHDHVNLSQSTNDAYPTALHVATLLGNDMLLAEIAELAKAFRRKGRAFRGIVKMGRTQLQDAVPMTLGQEFDAWAASIEDEIDSLRAVERWLCEVNMGGTAIGTGLNAPKGYSTKCARHLGRILGRKITLAADLIEATQDTQAFVVYHSAMRSLAIKLSKVCNDLRLLSSGPRAGLNEINLPAMQPGSSIMPGKVNPVIPEVMNQVCFKVIGNDTCVTMAAEAGQLQLNVMEPVIAQCIFEGQTLLANAARTLRTECVDGITANEKVCRDFVERSIGIVTALNPLIGYDRATEVAAEALASGRSVVDIVRERKWVDEKKLRAALATDNLIGRRKR
ncbi:MAG: aspartate ammonia-lyase [Phycisphaera sp.]|nr:aspartate ammonia-lyase [Phycisphaera sp.]